MDLPTLGSPTIATTGFAKSHHPFQAPFNEVLPVFATAVTDVQAIFNMFTVKSSRNTPSPALSMLCEIKAPPPDLPDSCLCRSVPVRRPATVTFVQKSFYLIHVYADISILFFNSHAISQICICQTPVAILILLSSEQSWFHVVLPIHSLNSCMSDTISPTCFHLWKFIFIVAGKSLRHYIKLSAMKTILEPYLSQRFCQPSTCSITSADDLLS